jgi:hypothetical protein
MIAAKINMLRITPHTFPGQHPRSHHIRRKAATDGGGKGCHFGEKDERSVNGVMKLSCPDLIRASIFFAGFFLNDGLLGQARP